MELKQSLSVLAAVLVLCSCISGHGGYSDEVHTSFKGSPGYFSEESGFCLVNYHLLITLTNDIPQVSIQSGSLPVIDSSVKADMSISVVMNAIRKKGLLLSSGDYIQSGSEFGRSPGNPERNG